MEFNFFKGQMNRLTETFGNMHYKEERIKLIWKEVQDLSSTWMIKSVDEFIGNLRQAPLMTEFREQIAKERERLHDIKKREHQQEAKEFTAAFEGEDFKTVLGQIKRRIQGNMSDEDFKCFVSMISPPTQYKCNRCQDTKVYQDPKDFTLYLCRH